MTAFAYALLFGVAFGLLVGNYAAWAAHEYGIVSPTYIGAIATIVVGFSTFVVLRKLA